MARIVLILGGVRSGKSRFAQDLAAKLGGDQVLFVATAEAKDGEMQERIAIHQRTRPTTWQTLECALKVGPALQASGDERETVLIDCLTLLVSNVLLTVEPPDASEAQRRIEQEVDLLLDACRARRGTVILVSGEVGMGLVPTHALGRQYRDLLGWANQSIAAVAEATYLMVAGLAINVRSLAVSLDDAAQALSADVDTNHDQFEN